MLGQVTNTLSSLGFCIVLFLMMLKPLLAQSNNVIDEAGFLVRLKSIAQNKGILNGDYVSQILDLPLIERQHNDLTEFHLAYPVKWIKLLTYEIRRVSSGNPISNVRLQLDTNVLCISIEGVRKEFGSDYIPVPNSPPLFHSDADRERFAQAVVHPFRELVYSFRGEPPLSVTFTFIGRQCAEAITFLANPSGMR